MSSAQQISTVMLPAQVDSATAASVEATLIAALRPGAPLIVDGSEVVYMSAAGVRTLATVLHRAAELKARIVFCRFSGPAADCLVVSGFSELFDVAETVAEAAARVGIGASAGPGERLHPRGAAG
jgi:anti-sigma B factor antagonist